MGFCQNVVNEYLIHSPAAVHKCFDHSSISNASDFGCGKVTLQGRSIVFIQGGEFHIFTKLTLYREQLSRPCKYQKRFNETMRDDSFQSTYYLWRGHSGKAARHPSALLLVARKS